MLGTSKESRRHTNGSHVFILIFPEDGIEKSPNQLKCSVFFPISTINIVLSHLSNYHPVFSLSPPLLPDLTSRKAILSVPAT